LGSTRVSLQADNCDSGVKVSPSVHAGKGSALAGVQVGAALGVPGSTVAEAAMVAEAGGTVAVGVASGVGTAAITLARAAGGGSAGAPEDAATRDRSVAPATAPQMATIAIARTSGRRRNP
jgi:hypothetical protein